MNRQQRKRIEQYSHNILNVMFRLKNDTGKLYGMGELYGAIQPFTIGDYSKVRTRLKIASKATEAILKQVDEMNYGTFTHILCDNLRAYVDNVRLATDH